MKSKFSFTLVPLVVLNSGLDHYIEKSVNASPETRVQWEAQRISSDLFEWFTFGNLPTGLDLISLFLLQDETLQKAHTSEHPLSFYYLDLLSRLDPEWSDLSALANMLAVIDRDGKGAQELLERMRTFIQNQLPHYPLHFQKRFWPNPWQIHLFLAYNAVFVLGNLPQAAIYFQEASTFEGAPPYLQELKEKLNQPNGIFRVAQKLLEFERLKIQVTIERSPTPLSKHSLEMNEINNKIRNLAVTEMLFELNTAFKTFREKHRHIQAGRAFQLFQKEGSMVDPWGGQLFLDSAHDQIKTTTPFSPFWGLTHQPPPSNTQKMTPLLEIQNVYQSFRTGFWLTPTPILTDIHFIIPEGSLFGFLGNNGAGKTTLIHLMTGIKRPSKGQILLNGIPVSLPETRRHIGYLPERPYFYEFLTGRKLLETLGGISGLSKERLSLRIPQVLERVGLSAHADKELKLYSKGMLQRIGIAQAIMHDPKLLILDEPMSGLDPSGRAEIRDLILQLAMEGTTIFFSSHVVSDVETLCNQVVILKHGRISQKGNILDLRNPEDDQILIQVLGAPSFLSHYGSVRKFGNISKLSLADRRQLPALLQRLIQENTEILSVSPEKSSLERLL